jgi:hypothetical protein
LESAGIQALGHVWNAIPSGTTGKSHWTRDCYLRLARKSLEGTNADGNEAPRSEVRSYSKGSGDIEVANISRNT